MSKSATSVLVFGVYMRTHVGRHFQAQPGTAGRI